MNLYKYFPIRDILRNYNKKDFTCDLIAGLATSLLIIPNAMAAAMLANLPPQMGLYSAIIPLIVYSIMGSSRHVSIAPSSVICLLIASSFTDMGLPLNQYIECAVLLSFISGAMLFFMGLLKAGFIENLLSNTVVRGFVAAAAIMIAVSQLKNFTGIELHDHPTIFGTIYELLLRFKDINIMTVIIGIISIGIIYFIRKITKLFPGSLGAIIAGITAVYFLELSSKGVAVVGSMAGGLPSFQFNDLILILGQERADLKYLFNIGIAITIISFVQSISLAKSIAAKTGQTVDANQELLALGSASIACSLFHTFPASGSVAGTASNYDAEGKSNVSSFISSVIIGIIILFFLPLLCHIPKACLAAVLIVTVAGLIDIKSYRHIFKSSKSDAFILVITFFVTLLFGVDMGIGTGIVLSIVLYLWRTALPNVMPLGRREGENGQYIYRTVKRLDEDIPLDTFSGILILRIDASLYFLNIKHVQIKITSLVYEGTDIKHIILDGEGINHIDYAAEEGLRKLIEDLKINKCNFYFALLKSSVKEFFKNSGFIEFLGEDRFFEKIEDAVKGINKFRV
ncbi:MAG: sulfate permease [Candidatus Eremiobacterota bacterium]